ncbi:hypothetical protein OHB26_09515 [Nocardia sp. NBC_01503]|uniref:hypothetical protein n=1 Tax=Nocardia sp. NBC_01503 TaxID=2975997 RepID=UPI002E7B4C94|nr:hypothetical protein [Nocardia sp. NBC_01503]WTL34413.1 hypothetical protein OHB26_09515 [Nocardia sp. NBC_01503]
MRIIRGNDDHNEDDHEHRRGRKPRDRGELSEILAGIPEGRVGDILSDEASDFLAAAVAAADRRRNAPEPEAPITPGSPKPALRLVKTGDHEVPEHIDAPTVRAGSRPRLLRAGFGGLLLVAAALALTAWGQPDVVAVPLIVYGLGWIAYLCWNTALRPPIPQVLAAVATAFGRTVAALIGGLAHAMRTGVSRVDLARTRHENTRTA